MKSFVPWRKLRVFRIQILVLFLCVFTFLAIIIILFPDWTVNSLNNFYNTSSYNNDERERLLLRIKQRTDVAGGVNKNNPLLEEDSINYGVVIDCGSSGSRLFVYYWNQHSGRPGHLLDIKILTEPSDNNKTAVAKIEPGLSSFAKKPSQASDYLAPLLKFASDQIPKHKVKETPLYILATAGMRLLPKEEQAAILNDLQTDLSLDFNFIFSPTHVEVISGKWEGIYAWTALNHALGKFNHKLSDDSLVAVDVGNKVHIRKRTVGILDLGGASLQMTLEIPQTHSFIDSTVKNNVIEFNLGCSSSDTSHIYKIYSQTFLGKGSNEGRLKYQEWLLHQYFLNNTSTSNDRNSSNNLFPLFKNETSLKITPGLVTNSTTLYSNFLLKPQTLNKRLINVIDPCLSLSYNENHTRDNIIYNITGSGDLLLCVQYLKNILNKTKNCFFLNKRKCSMDGVVLPDINFGITEFFGFSEFFYTMQDILNIGGAYNFYHYVQQAKTYCMTNWSTIENWKKTLKYSRADAQRYRLQCFKSAWMLLVLHEGLNVPLNYQHFTSIQFINNYEIHWSLGALLHKTKYFPLRDIEKAQKHLNKSPNKGSVTLKMTVIIMALSSTLIAVLYFCSLFVWPAKFKFHNPRVININEEDECKIDMKSHDYRMKMIRSRSYGFFADSTQNI